MNSRTMLRTVTINCCIFACIAATIPDIICVDEIPPKTAGNGIPNNVNGSNLGFPMVSHPNLLGFINAMLSLVKEMPTRDEMRAELMKASQNPQLFYEINIKYLKEHLNDPDLESNNESLSTIEEQFRNAPIFKNMDTSEALELLRNAEEEIARHNRNNGGINVNGIISIIIPLFLAIFIKY